MNHDYDATTAMHYAAYRPLLHGTILQSSLGSERFNSGLDIGCGTGQSAIALADFCHSVTGIDPSAEMISKALPHANISYALYDKERIAYQDNSFDIITLAGSLWYAKSQELLDEIIRVGCEHAAVLVYDFEVLLEDVLTKVGAHTKSDIENSYNHKEDFSGLEGNTLVKIKQSSDTLSMQIANTDLAHLILAVKNQYASLANSYGAPGLYDKLVMRLNSAVNCGYFNIQAHTFATLYRLR